MYISTIELYHVAVPFHTPYRLSRRYGTLPETQAVVLRVATDTGLTGWGEADPHPPFTEETVSGVLALLRRHLLPPLLGADPRAINRLLNGADAQVAGNPLAKGAIDMALHDLAAKSAGLAVHELLGGALHRELPVLWPLGSGTAGEDAAVIEERRAQGYGSFMLKCGARAVDADVARVCATVDRFGAEARFIVDANQGWDRPEAVRFVHGIRETAVEFIEQPLAAADVAGLRRVRELATSPVSADESLVTEHDALRLIRAEAVDVFSLKVSKNGGIAATRRIGALARSAGVSCLMNSMLEFGITQAASLALGCTLPNLVGCGHAYMSTLRLADDFTSFPHQVDGGVVRVSDRPGLGIEVDEDKLAHLARGHWRIEERPAGGGVR